MAQTIKRNFFYNLLLQVSKVLFPLVTAPYIARVLDPEGVGIANFVNTYSSYFALFAVLGIPLYGIREIAKKQNDLKASEEFVSQMISIELFSTLFVSFFYLLSVLVYHLCFRHLNKILILCFQIWFGNKQNSFHLPY